MKVDMVADIEVDMVADIEVDMMAEILSLSTPPPKCPKR